MKVYLRSRNETGPAEIVQAINNEKAQAWDDETGQKSDFFVGVGKVIIHPSDYSISGYTLTEYELGSLLRKVQERRRTIEELLERFEKDILYNAHSLGARIENSDAGKELIKQGAGVIGEIALRLTNYDLPTTYPELRTELKIAWCTLISTLCSNIGMNGGQLTVHDFHSWVAWARWFSQK